MFRWEAESDTISKPDASATSADGLEHSSEESEDLEGASADFQITQTYLEYLGDSYEKRQAEPLSSRLERISSRKSCPPDTPAQTFGVKLLQI